MDYDIKDYAIIEPVKAQTELEKVVMYFIQDFDLCNFEVDETIEQALLMLDASQKQRLTIQIHQILAQNKDEKSLRKIWVSLGAEYYPEGHTITELLNKILKETNKHQ